MLVQLNSGHFDENSQSKSDDVNMIEKDALLVYPGKFMSMDGEVEVTEDHLTKLSTNHNSMLSKAKRLATGEIALKDMPPIQLDHEAKATHTVGRLIGNVEVKDTEIDGKATKGLFGRVRVLGRENVEKVKDGRWIHLSIGADLESGKLNELTITPFPAAANASMLARKNLGIHSGSLEHRENYKGKSIKIFIKELSAGMQSNKFPTGYYFFGEVNGKDVQEDGVLVLGQTVDEVVMAAKKLIDSKKLASEDTAPVRMADKKIKDLKYKKFDIEIEQRPDGFYWFAADMFGCEPTALEAENKAKAYVDRVEFEFKDKNKKLSMGDDMDYKSMKEKMAMYAKCKQHLMEKEKLSEEDAEKKLAEMPHDDAAKMADAQTKDEGENKEKKMARMAKAKTITDKLQKSIEDNRFAQTKTKVVVRLNALKSVGKITPAEIKNVKLEELATRPEGEVNAFLLAFENREKPVIDPGVYGTTKAVNMAALQQQVELKRLEDETRANMSSVKKAKKNTKMAGDSASEVEKTMTEKVAQEVNSTSGNPAMPGKPGEDSHMKHLGDLEIIHHMMKEGKHDEAMNAMSAHIDKVKTMASDKIQEKDEKEMSMSDDEAKKHLSALESSQKELEAQMKETQRLISELVD